MLGVTGIPAMEVGRTSGGAMPNDLRANTVRGPRVVPGGHGKRGMPSCHGLMGNPRPHPEEITPPGFYENYRPPMYPLLAPKERYKGDAKIKG